jgi:hypothetical protein
VRRNVSSASGTGRSSKKGRLHFPHCGRSCARAASTRFHVSQNWQRIVTYFVAGADGSGDRSVGWLLGAVALEMGMVS